MAKKIDKYQKAAIDVDINAVVSAGAGSGKTTVLSERFSHLVIEKGYTVDQILTLTFTKEATVEMSSRIYGALRDHNSPEAANFYKANIKTIDSYCNSVAKIGAHLYGVSPDFAQSDDIESKINSMALPFILEHRDNQAIKTFVDTKNYEEKAYEIFVSPILENSTVSEPIDFKKAFKVQSEIIIKAWKENYRLGVKINSALSNAIQSFEGNKSSATFSKLAETFQNLELPAEHDLTYEEILSGEATVLLATCDYFNQLAGIRKPSGNGTDEIKEVLDEIRNISGVLESIVNFVTSSKTAQELIKLLEQFQQMVNDYKRRTGQLTFKDIASLATCTLRDYPELRQIEKEKYKAIMIDEFQDNNSEQRDLLFMLSERLDRHEKGIPQVQDLCPDKLFFVGDEKQSIYRFRGADVSVFRGLSKDFEKGNLSMTTNYRSEPALIACFNTIFGGYEYPPAKGDNQIVHTSVFYNEKQEKSLGAENIEIPDFEAVYHEVTMPEDTQKNLSAMSKDELQETFQPHIHIALYDKDQKAEHDQLVEEEAEAYWVAEKINQLIESGKYKAEDMAILFRDYKFQALYERALLSHGIPYNTAAVSGFFADGPVNDIFAFLRLCVYPKDTMPYAQLLKGPLMNLSNAETQAILCQNAPVFQADTTLLSQDSQRRYQHLKDAFQQLVQTVKEGSITKAVTMLWYSLGYRYETMWNQTVELYGKMYDLIFELCRQAEQENQSLSQFVDSMNTYQDQAARLEGLNIPMEQVNGVHIMTIHKSKGLEFPVVFLCGTQKLGRNDTNAEPTYCSKEYGLSVNTPGKTNYFYSLVKEKNAKMASAELRRLTYVALTRAKSQLYITNAKYSKTDEAEGKYSPNGSSNPRTIWNILEPVVNHYLDAEPSEIAQMPFDVEEITPQNRNFDSDKKVRRNKAEEKLKLIDSIEESKLFEKAEVLEPDVPESKYVQPSQLHGSDDETAKDGKITTVSIGCPFPEITDIVNRHHEKFDFTNFGTIAHAYMEALINEEDVKISAKDLAGLDDDKKAVETIHNVCTQMQETFKKSELGKAAIGSQWHKAEYEFRSRVKSKIVKGIIDLLFVDSDKNCTIVDFKTNQEVIPELYYKQLACYRHAVASMMNIEDPKSIRCVLYYLRHGKTEDISTNCDEIDLEKAVLEIQ